MSKDPDNFDSESPAIPAVATATDAPAAPDAVAPEPGIGAEARAFADAEVGAFKRKKGHKMPRDWDRHGGRKPGVDDPSHWQSKRAPKKLNPQHEFIIHLAACGCTPGEIARRMGLTGPWITTMLSNPRFTAEITRVRKEMFDQDPEKMLRMLVPQAITVVKEVLEDTTERGSTRVDAAFKLFDRTHGRAVQRIEHQGTMLKDLFRQLDQLETKHVDLPAGGAESEPTPTEDDWLDKNLPH